MQRPTCRVQTPWPAREEGMRKAARRKGPQQLSTQLPPQNPPPVVRSLARSQQESSRMGTHRDVGNPARPSAPPRSSARDRRGVQASTRRHLNQPHLTTGPPDADGRALRVSWPASLDSPRPRPAMTRPRGRGCSLCSVSGNRSPSRHRRSPGACRDAQTERRPGEGEGARDRAGARDEARSTLERGKSRSPASGGLAAIGGRRAGNGGGWQRRCAGASLA